VAVNPSAPKGKSLKYAHIERERRFLLAGVPDGSVVQRALITDRYIKGTHLRLRRSEFGDRIERKLGQKAHGLITNIYVDEAEYQVLSALPADVLHKSRLSIPPFGVDVFDVPLAGLVMAEFEFESDEEMTAFEPPLWAVAEVTDDVRFTGGRLVTTTTEELRSLLAEFSLEPAPGPAPPSQSTG
jgi:CYTH domain-containing protein